MLVGLNNLFARHTLSRNSVCLSHDFSKKFLHSFVNKKFDSDITFLGRKFQQGMPLSLDHSSTLIASGVLQTIHTPIFSTNQPFNFRDNGFEFHDFRGTSLQTPIETLSLGPDQWEQINPATIRAHTCEIEKVLANWGKKQGIDFKQVICIDSVFRNTAQGLFRAVQFAHVDFPLEKKKETLRDHKNWKERVEERLGPMSNEEYTSLKVSQFVNIWMPLNLRLEAYPLAIMDIRTIKSTQETLAIYQDRRLNGGDVYYSVGVVPHESQQWYVKNEMELGEAVIFDSCLTPHTAVRFPDQGEKQRTSIECRVIFL